MEKYTNRGGRVVTLDTNSKEIIQAIAEGEFVLIEEEVEAPVKKPVKKECPKEGCPIVLDKKVLTAIYVDKFGKRPLAGWGAEKLAEKLAE